MAGKEKTAKTADKPGYIMKSVNMLGRVGLTISFVAVALFAVQFGAAELDRRAEASPEPEAAAIIPVSTSPVEFNQGYEVQRTFIGQVEPQKTTSLSFELAGKLANISVEEGHYVKKGQVLAKQDVSLLLAEQDQLNASKAANEAQLVFANQTVERNSQLSKRGFTSQAGLDEAMARQSELLARIAEIDARLSSVSIRISKATLVAPFDGQITERLVDGSETLSAGQRVLGLLDTRKPQARVGVPLDVTEADLKDAIIKINGVERAAELLSLRPDIDQITRTRTAIFEIATLEVPAFGQTARLVFSEWIEADGVWTLITSLKEGVRGQWTVLVVDAENIVKTASVEILHAETNRVFVRGAFPQGTRLVNEGPQRVTVGQRVTLASTQD
ncbi:MAG: efflux RND transporter periplasmic adaptor subunit [Pseudomonadota bacterium]